MWCCCIIARYCIFVKDAWRVVGFDVRLHFWQGFATELMRNIDTHQVLQRENGRFQTTEVGGHRQGLVLHEERSRDASRLLGRIFLTWGPPRVAEPCFIATSKM